MLRDPLRFGAASVEDDDAHVEISLDDPPATSRPVAPSTAPSAARSGAKSPAGFDPLTSHPDHSPKQQPAHVVGPLGRTSSSSSGQPASPSDPLSRYSRPSSGAYEGSDAFAPGSASPSGFNGSVLEEVDIREGERLDRGTPRDATGEAGPSQRLNGAQQSQRITVTDPVKRIGDATFIPGITGSHVEYLVSTTRGGGGGGGSAAEPSRTQVRRRFNDFMALADLLEEAHRGYVIPPRPDKGALDGAASGRTEAEFLQSRRRELERYLNRLAAHPVLGGSEELRTFLQAEGALAASFQWQQLQPLRGSLLEGVARLPRQLLGVNASLPTTTEVTKNARHTNDLLRRIKELGERVKQEYQPQVELPDEEVKLREARAGIEGYAEALAVATRRAERVVREFERVGQATGDLGLALIKLAKYEDEVGGRSVPYSEFSSPAKAAAADARCVGHAALQVSRLARSATLESVGALEPLHTELAMAPSVVAALREREAALLTAHSVQEELERKKAALTALEGGAAGGDAGRARRAAALRDEIAAAEAATEAARAEYERVKRRNQSELERREAAQAAGFRLVAHGYARVGAEYEERRAMAWHNLGEE